MTQKTKEELQEQHKKDELNHKKMVFDTYVECLAKYATVEVGYQSIYFGKLKDKALANIGTSGNLDDFLFGKPISNEDYYDKLIKYAEERIKDLPLETRKQIAKDSLINSLNYFEWTGEITKTKKGQ